MEALEKKKGSVRPLRLPPLPFSSPPPYNLSIEAGGFTVSPALFNTLTH